MLLPFADAIFWIAVACCFVAQVALLRSALVAPMVQPSDRNLPVPSRGREVAWTVVPAIGLAVLLWATWHRIRDGEDRRPAAPAVVVSTTAS
jgi:heme/copper-type cytochrome/quinol oxidase subunit 2